VLITSKKDLTLRLSNRKISSDEPVIVGITLVDNRMRVTFVISIQVDGSMSQTSRRQNFYDVNYARVSEHDLDYRLNLASLDGFELSGAFAAPESHQVHMVCQAGHVRNRPRSASHNTFSMGNSR